ncbi:MAG: autotransporter-associated beta strand repeat-containing protein [Terrimicrobiaceae bacterium]
MMNTELKVIRSSARLMAPRRSHPLKPSLFLLGALAASLTIGLSSALAQTDYSFTNGGGTGLWNNASNWSPGDGPPLAGDNVVTPTAFSTLSLDISPTVGNWTYSSATSQFVRSVTVPRTLTITGTLSKSLGGTLTFNSVDATNTLALGMGAVEVSGGTLDLGRRNVTASALSTLSAGSANITGGSLRLNVSGAAAITGTATLSGSGRLLLAEDIGVTRSVSVGALSSASSTAIVAANDSSADASTGTLILTASSGSADYAGQIKNSAGTNVVSVVSVQKDNAGTQIFSGNSNTYSGGTVVNAGTLLVNNTSGSGLGTGAVSVAGGNLGGTGIITPTGANGITVASGGNIAPGASIGTLTLNLGSTTGTVNLTGGGDFKFELGTANVSIGAIAAGSSDLLAVAGASASDVAFGGSNDINLLGTATAEGYYKLFDTSFDDTTWTGLTVGGITTGGNLITGGLTASNYGGSFSGELILADGTAGTSAGDIYLHVVPEPATWGLLASGLTTVLVLRRRRQS